MTRNQLSYHQLREETRANQARESENYRHNVANEQQAKAELAEQKRANSLNAGANYIKAIASVF